MANIYKGTLGLIGNTPLVEATQDVVADANIFDQGGGKSMSSMRETYNSHTHDETQSVTAPPNQPM